MPPASSGCCEDSEWEPVSDKSPQDYIDQMILDRQFGGVKTSHAKVRIESPPGWVGELRAVPSTEMIIIDLLPGLLMSLGETTRVTKKYIIVQVQVSDGGFKLTCILCSCACLSTSCTLKELIEDAGEGAVNVSFTAHTVLKPVVGKPFYIGRVSARQAAMKAPKKPRKPSERSGSDADSETGGDTGDEKDSKSLRREAANESKQLADAPDQPVRKKRILSGSDRSLLLSTATARGLVIYWLECLRWIFYVLFVRHLRRN